MHCFMVQVLPTVVCYAHFDEIVPGFPCKFRDAHRGEVEYARFDLANPADSFELPPAPAGILATSCRDCGRPLTAAQKRVGSGGHRLWLQPETGEVRHAPSDFGPGAMWEAPWLERWIASFWDNWPAGQAPLEVMTPGGPFVVDARASNCDQKEDRAHRCWVRQGTAPDITLDKNGLTCDAGAGSILMNGWHGYLHNGDLHE
jgi:hypothetical protein